MVDLIFAMNLIVTILVFFFSLLLLSSFLISFNNLSSNNVFELSGIIFPWSLELHEDNSRTSQSDHKKTNINDIVESNNVCKLRNINPSDNVGKRKSFPIDSINL